MTSEIRIYVASLSDYNAGNLHGEWIDATQDVADIYYDIQKMLWSSPLAKNEAPTHDSDEWETHSVLCQCNQCTAPEEYAIHDYEGFGQFNVSEYADLDKVSAIAKCIEEHGEAFGAWVGLTDIDDVDCDDLSDKFLEAYQGEHDDVADYAQHIAEELEYLTIHDDGGGYSVSKPKDLSGQWPFTCIDWSRAGRELEIGGDINTVPTGHGTIYVFNANV